MSIASTPLTIRGLSIPNRVVVPAMSTMMAEAGQGLANDQHLVHYASLAEAGVGLIIMESAAVQARGYISSYDLGLWDDSQIQGLKRITNYIHTNTQSKIAIQLNHAGPKGLRRGISTTPSQYTMEESLGGELIAASSIACGDGHRTPREMTIQDIEMVKVSFVMAAKRAVIAGFDAIEIHGGHGYLLHNFYSPLTNKREGEYGGSFENRTRFILEVVEMIRNVIPETMPFLCRLSCTDWVEGGWSIEDSVKLCKELKSRGVDVINCSSGGALSDQDTRVGVYYQVPFAEIIKQQAHICTLAVGGIESMAEVEAILRQDGADLVAIGRSHLKDAYWFRHQVLKTNKTPWHPPRQMMGFMASQRRQAKEQAAAASKSHAEGHSAAHSSVGEVQSVTN